MTALKLILALAFASYAACTKINLPTDFSTVASGTRANLKSNFDEIDTRADACFDSTDEVRGRLSGYTGDFTITSMDNLRLKLDADGSTTSKFIVMTSNLDSLFRVSEDSSAKFFGTLAITGRTTLTDSLIGVSQRLSGNLAVANGAYSGTLGVTGLLTASAGVSVPDATGLTSSISASTRTLIARSGTTLNIGENGGWTGVNYRTTSGTHDFTIGGNSRFTVSAGGGTVDGGLSVSGTGSAADAKMFATSADGLALRGKAGSSYDFALYNPAAQYLMRNPTGTQGVEFQGLVTGAAHLLSSGTSPAYRWDQTTAAADERLWDAQAAGGQLLFRSRTDANGTGATWLTVDRTGTTVDGIAFTGPVSISGVTTLGNYVSTRMPYFGTAGVVSTTSDLTWTPGTTTFATANGTYSGTLGVTGVATFTAAPVFSSVTASQILSVNGSKALTSVATTGSGSVALATSPTLVTPVLGAATGTSLNLSGNLTADSLVSSKFYAEGSFTATLTGTTVLTTGTAYYVRVGKQVTLVLPSLFGGSNSTACTITGLPAALIPARNQWFIATTQDNGSIVSASPNGNGIIIQTSGVIQLWFGASTTFTSSGSKGLNSGAVHAPFTYTLL
jgi:hypothetical protein